MKTKLTTYRIKLIELDEKVDDLNKEIINIKRGKI